MSESNSAAVYYIVFIVAGAFLVAAFFCGACIFCLSRLRMALRHGRATILPLTLLPEKIVHTEESNSLAATERRASDGGKTHLRR